MAHEQQAPTTWADATPAGLFATAAGTTAVWALLTGAFGTLHIESLPTMLIWLIGAAIILSIVGLIALRRGDTISGCLNLAFGVLFFGIPALGYVILLWGGTPVANISGGLISDLPTLATNGWVFFVLALVLATFIPIVGKQSKIFMVALLVFVVAIILLALFTLQPATAQMLPGMWHNVGAIAGWMIGLAGLLMLYVGMAMALLYGLGRVVLPIK